MRDLEADLAPLIDDPGAAIFVGLINVAVEEFKAKVFRAGFLQQALRFDTRLLDIGRIAGELL